MQPLGALLRLELVAGLPQQVRDVDGRQRIGALDQEKLTPLLRLKYHGSIADAVAELGRPDEIGKLFVGFQKYLYQRAA